LFEEVDETDVGDGGVVGEGGVVERGDSLRGVLVSLAIEFTTSTVWGDSSLGLMPVEVRERRVLVSW
jgi:hypothetical protein